MKIAYQRFLFLWLVVFSACPGEEPRRSTTQTTKPSQKTDRRVDSRPPPLAEPVPLWVDGKPTKDIDAATAAEEGYIILDLGDDWTPYIFSERGNDNEDKVSNAYRTTYLELAKGRYPEDHHGERAKRDKYLELYGIQPTLSVLRQRFNDMTERSCVAEIKLEPFQEYESVVTYRSNERARLVSRRYPILKREVDAMVKRHNVSSVDELSKVELSTRDQRYLHEYKQIAPDYEIVAHLQERLRCEGYLEDKGRIIQGGMDWATHEGLAEFERRHRVYSWGFIGQRTLAKLRKSTLELEREDVVRVLTERAIHAAGVIEDGSTSMKQDDTPRTFQGSDGKQHPIPNMEAKLRAAVVRAFGLETPESTRKWLQERNDLSGKNLVAFRSPPLPEYYDGDMEISVVIDRGDVWYEFPFDEKGGKLPQPVQRRPRLTVSTKYLNQSIPLARYGTTIGGWRSELVEGNVMWKYKNSPTGSRVWHQIVASPVWLPPEGTPPGSLLKRVPGKTGKNRYEVNYHEVGPSYASAYGLVAAYHVKFRKAEDGSVHFGGDEGIRTHGSVDYMSIMRRHSHGCHRLHNHLAVRLMSFVLAHRPHVRVGQQTIAFRRTLPYEGYDYHMALNHGGYIFDLERPVPVSVLEGRIRGRVKNPIPHPIPQYDEDAGIYVHPDAGAVEINFAGKMRTVPYPDGGPVDGGTVDAGSTPPLPSPSAVPSIPNSQAPNSQKPDSQKPDTQRPSVPAPDPQKPSLGVNVPRPTGISTTAPAKQNPNTVSTPSKP